MTGETKEQLAAERDQLARDNEALTRQLDEARAELDRAAGTPAGGRGRAPAGPPSFGISEGERQDLQTRGTTTSPWTGEQLIADEQGITPASDDARAAADRARSRRDAGDDAAGR